MTSIDAIVYSESQRHEWDSFVDTSLNGLFFHKRSFLDYHGDRFFDSSLVFRTRKQDQILALLPAARVENQGCSRLVSHPGITFGGLVLGKEARLRDIESILLKVKEVMLETGLRSLDYRPVPHIYTRQCTEADLYLLHQLGASIESSSLSSAINLNSRIRFSKGKKYMVKKGIREGVVARKTHDYACFWAMLEKLLKEKYEKKATHSLEEIQMLAQRFPKEIGLYSSYLGEEMIAGLVTFSLGNSMHIQYIASNHIGRNLGGIDIIVDHLVTTIKDHEWLDFGVSTTDEGRVVNYGLLDQKEMFGARGVQQLCYRMDAQA